MGLSSEASRLFAILSRSQPLGTVNRPQSALQICIGVLGVIGTIALLSTLRNHNLLKGTDGSSSTDEKKPAPPSKDNVQKPDAYIPIERIKTPPPAYERGYIDAASPALIDDMAESVEDGEEEMVSTPSSGSRFRKRMKKTFKIGRKNSAQS
ncbi:hypothetical protein IQ06DRAFT_297456 [Phaeosphaeriaceae sp. SRC1lsM3a]|nr:hypothetical protein IQ06DRAFT_297456 [Stagonospora sp. SRC1lsM3a]